MPSITRHLAALALSMLAVQASAQPTAPFRFESLATLDEMQAFVRTRFPPGAAKDDLHRTFMAEGGGSLRLHPRRPHVEKYLYDINLCRLYVWRWNISADYDERGRLLQAYVNGEPLHASGPQKRQGGALADSGKAKILKLSRPRPETSMGEKALVYLLLDGDGDPATTDDQVLAGGGPSRADPADFGKMIAYTDVDPWRSIFDADPADRIVDYAGSCPASK